MTNILCLDIEAVVDQAVWTPPPDKIDAFAPPYAWRPICVGMVLLESAAAGLQVRRIGAIDEQDQDECALLARFAGTLDKLRPTLVTWNGRAYDLPVLMLRSLRYGIRHPGYYQSRDMRYRFTEDGHCDLMDAMSDYGASRALGLDGMAKLVGLPGKIGTLDGAAVGEAYAAGRLGEITTYCLGDAVSTAFLWLRWQLLKGTMDLKFYQASARALLVACEAEPRLGPLVAAMDRPTLLLERELAA
jgi:predicted PolB exonuclease-like 3'-5' exonuclease